MHCRFLATALAACATVALQVKHGAIEAIFDEFLRLSASPGIVHRWD